MVRRQQGSKVVVLDHVVSVSDSNNVVAGVTVSNDAWRWKNTTDTFKIAMKITSTVLQEGWEGEG
jgi:hypothetical protein